MGIKKIKLTMSRHKPEINKKKLIEALNRTLGLVSPACEEVGVSRETFYRYLREDEEFRRQVQEIDEIVIDFAENQLFKKIKEGSERSILFFMKYKGRKRGYTDSLDITTNGENLNNIKIEIIRNKPDEEKEK